MINIKNDLCKSTIIIAGFYTVYSIIKLGIENNYELEFNCSNVTLKFINPTAHILSSSNSN